MRKAVVDRRASVRAKLLTLSKQRGLAFDPILTRYALERLLDRLSRSRHVERFALKGAMLLTAWIDDPMRGTRDLDLLGFGDPDLEGLKAASRRSWRSTPTMASSSIMPRCGLSRYVKTMPGGNR